MSYIDQHVNGVFNGHQEVIHLIELVLVGDHFSHEERVQDSVPVEESAASGLTDVCFPVTDQIKLPVPEIDLTQLLRVEYMSLDKIHAMAHDGATQLVVPSSVALQDSDHQLEHVIKVKSSL